MADQRREENSFGRSHSYSVILLRLYRHILHYTLKIEQKQLFLRKQILTLEKLLRHFSCVHFRKILYSLDFRKDKGTYKLQIMPNNADELKATVKETRASIPPQQCHKLITSMPRRIEAVIKAKGAPTKY